MLAEVYAAVLHLLPDWLARDYVWLIVMVLGLGSAIIHLVVSILGWTGTGKLSDPPAGRDEWDLAGAQLALGITGCILILSLVACVAMLVFAWPPQPLRAGLIRWVSGVGVLTWATGMSWARRLRGRVSARARARRIREFEARQTIAPPAPSDQSVPMRESA